MRKTLWILAAFALLPALAAAQDDYEFDDFAGSEGGWEPGAGAGLVNDYLVDSPTALLLGHGQYRITARMMAQGSIVARTELGIQDVFSVGVSWGMLGLLGTGDVDTYERTGLALRFRLAREGELGRLGLALSDEEEGWNDDQAECARQVEDELEVLLPEELP